MLLEVLDRLSEEHRELLPLLVAVQRAAESGDAAALAAKLAGAQAALTGELDAHIVLEDDIAFPAIAEALGDGIVTPFRAEHVEIRELRDQVLANAAEGRVSVARALQLCDLITAHMEREEAMLFPSAREALAGGRA